MAFGHGSRDLLAFGQRQNGCCSRSRRRPDASRPDQDALNGGVRTVEQLGDLVQRPTLLPSFPPGHLSSRCGFAASLATLLLLTQRLVCCVDRLNPPSEAGTRTVSQRYQIPPVRSTSSLVRPLPFCFGEDAGPDLMLTKPRLAERRAKEIGVTNSALLSNCFRTLRSAQDAVSLPRRGSGWRQLE